MVHWVGEAGDSVKQRDKNAEPSTDRCAMVQMDPIRDPGLWNVVNQHSTHRSLETGAKCYSNGRRAVTETYHRVAMVEAATKAWT